MIPLKIFVVDDEEILRVTLSDELREAGYKTYEFRSADEALANFDKIKPDIMFTDIRMPGKNGIELLEQVMKKDESVTVVVMTSFGSVESAVQSMKLGAYDYITKPFETDEVLLLLERIKEVRALQEKCILYEAEKKSQFSYSSFVGLSQPIKNIFSLLDKIINTNSTVLVTGETGTGKELLANIIHYNSNRKDKPFVKVSCAILSREIFESELFGHEKGAFTGAHKEKRGRFELADGGTIYLDDVDDIPIDLQVKLLRVLELQEIEKVGSSESIHLDVRIIASTKADLNLLVQKGAFRKDLFYRLNVFPIEIKPLRERSEDVPVLIEHFRKMFSPIKHISFAPEIIEILSRHKWSGNVRELKNVVERMILLADANEIDITKVPHEIILDKNLINPVIPDDTSLEELLRKVEMNAIKSALTKAQGNKTKAAQLLGIPPSTLRTKMDKHGL
jgi:DNA-binding NtrC family response regulator